MYPVWWVASAPLQCDDSWEPLAPLRIPSSRREGQGENRLESAQSIAHDWRSMKSISDHAQQRACKSDIRTIVLMASLFAGTIVCTWTEFVFLGQDQFWKCPLCRLLWAQYRCTNAHSPVFATLAHMQILHLRQRPSSDYTHIAVRGEGRSVAVRNPRYVWPNGTSL
jgi:hypothetical protein